jgi:hypothetical protein
VVDATVMKFCAHAAGAAVPSAIAAIETANSLLLLKFMAVLLG